MRTTRRWTPALFILACLTGCISEGAKPTATKSAAGHHAVVFHWTLNKSASPDTFSLLTGETGTAQFSIAATKDAGSTTFFVEGEVCVTNEGNQSTDGLAITDQVLDPSNPQGPALASVAVDVSERPVLDPNETHCYPYHVDFQPPAVDAQYQNVALVRVNNFASGSAGCPGRNPCLSGPDVSTAFTLSSALDMVTNNSIHVTDTNGQSFVLSASGSRTYQKGFVCPADDGAHKNTATIAETGQSSDAIVTVNCLGDAARLTATKTATGHRAQTFNWSINKSALPDTVNLIDGQTSMVQFTIEATKSDGPDAFFVDGQVCVTNTGNQPTEDLAITDDVLAQVGGAAQQLASAIVDVSAKPVLAPGESHCYPYHVAFTPVGNAIHLNAAHVTVTNFADHLLGSANCPGPAPCPFGPDTSVAFALPATTDSIINDTIHVEDTNSQSFTFNASGTQSYNKNFACPADQGQHSNTATITETGQTASANVEVICRCVDSLPRQSGPIALSCDNKMLANVNPDNNTLTLLDPTLALPAVITEIPVGRDPGSVAIHPDDTKAYVANARDGTVSVIDVAAQAVAQTIHVGVEPSAVVLSPNASRLYVANSASNSLTVVDTSTNSTVATIDLSAFGTAPRAITVTNNGDLNDADETVYVAMFYAQLRPGKTFFDEGQDDEREGRVVAISAATNTPLGAPNPIILGPLASTGFNSNGQLAPATGLTPAVPSTNPPPAPLTTPTAGFPNQLAAIAIQPGSSNAYVVSTAASPNGPFRFNVMAQGLVSVFDATSRLEISAAQTDPSVRRTAPLNLNQGTNMGTTPAPRLFLTNPVALAWRPDGSDAWIAIQNSDVIVRMTVDGNGVPTVGNPLVAGPSVQVRADLQTQSGLLTEAQAPRGIVINAAGTRAFVSNFVGRSVTTIDISNPTAPSIIGSTQSTALPASGTAAATALLGQALFYTGRGPQTRMSSESWGGCIVCHPSGRSDNVTWMFDAGPRQTIPLDGMFNKANTADQRILNWSAVRDENHDFELNTRGVFGGRGLIDDDRLFLAIGGASGATPTDSGLIEQFQQFTGALGTTNDLAGAALPTISARRDFAIATRDDNDHVFIIGGRTGAGQGSLVAASDAVVEFDPRANTLTPRSSIGFSIRHSFGAAAVRTSGGFRIYAIGGYADTANTASPVATVEEFNPATDTWRAVASLPSAAAQFGITVAGGINTADPLQLIHVVGGNAGSESAPSLVTAAFGVQRFTADPAGPGVWSNFNVAGLMIRRNHGVASVLRGASARIFVIGGQDATSNILDVEEYTNATVPALVATPHTSLPAPRARFGIGATKTTNQIYVMGGVDGVGADETSVFEYTIANNGPVAGPPGTPSGTWVTRGNLSVARSGLQVSTPPGVTNFLTARSAGRDARQDAIALFVQTIRSARAPILASDAEATAGRALFGTVGLVVPGFSCATCHGGPKWTRSQVDYTPPPSPEVVLGLGNERVIGAELRQTVTQPNTPSPSGGFFPGVLVNVGTFTPNSAGGRTNEIRVNAADPSQAIAPLGANGFNIPSLLSVHETAPYFYSGLAQSLDEVLDGSKDGNGGTQHHFVADVTQRAQLIAFLRSIDDTTPIFP